MSEVLHIVLFRWKDAATHEQVEEAHRRLRDLKRLIPGILEIHCGRNFSERGQGFETVLFVRFRDREALNAYLPHPAHRAVVEEVIQPIRENSLAVDIVADPQLQEEQAVA